MYRVIVVSTTERVIFSGNDGFIALDVSRKYRATTKFAVVLQTPTGRIFTMAKQDIMMRRLKCH